MFGAFCKPFYNSVIATFCHQLNYNEEPEIHVDAEIEYIYVGNLIEKICKLIKDKDINNQKMVIFLLGKNFFYNMENCHDFELTL